MWYIIHEGVIKKGGTGLPGVGLGSHLYSVLVLIATRKGDRGLRWGGLPAFMFAGVVLAVVLIIIVFRGGFHGSWCPFVFVSTGC